MSRGKMDLNHHLCKTFSQYSTIELFPQEPSDGIEPPTNRLVPAALKPLSYEGLAEPQRR